jgi:hypothetical protein
MSVLFLHPQACLARNFIDLIYLSAHRISSVAAMTTNGLNLFLLIASIFEILLLQIGYVRSAPKNSSKTSRAQA